MKLETKRLILRPPKLSDANDIFEGFSNLNVLKFIFNIPYPYKLKDTISWIKKHLKYQKKKKIDKYEFCLELKNTKKVIGIVGLSINWKNKVAETGSWISEDYWKQGYVTEAKIAVLDFAFNKLKIRKLESATLKENIASKTALKKLGFKKEGLLRKKIISPITGKIHDQCRFGLLKEEWEEARKKLIKK
jgi:ribosomal-protein-alanine N-acetyltransferase